MLGAGELHVMGELVNQGIGQIGRRPRNPQDDRRCPGPVFGSIREFPGCCEGHRRDAIQMPRVRSEEFVPRVRSDAAKVVGNRVGEAQHGWRVGTGEDKSAGKGTNQQHGERNSTTHEARLPFPDSGSDGKRANEHDEMPGITPTGTDTKEKQC